MIRLSDFKPEGMFAVDEALENYQNAKYYWYGYDEEV